eukprot:PhF_6_TR35085/c0_g2_i2/m.51135
MNSIKTPDRRGSKTDRESVAIMFSPDVSHERTHPCYCPICMMHFPREYVFIVQCCSHNVCLFCCKDLHALISENQSHLTSPCPYCCQQNSNLLYVSEVEASRLRSYKDSPNVVAYQKGNQNKMTSPLKYLSPIRVLEIRSAERNSAGPQHEVRPTQVTNERERTNHMSASDRSVPARPPRAPKRKDKKRDTPATTTIEIMPQSHVDNVNQNSSVLSDKNKNTSWWSCCQASAVVVPSPPPAAVVAGPAHIPPQSLENVPPEEANNTSTVCS